MPDQEDIEDKGGTMRLGAYPCKLEKGTKAFDIYGEEVIYERHRHRYEVNNEVSRQAPRGRHGDFRRLARWSVSPR